MTKSHQVTLVANGDGTWTATALADPNATVTGPLLDLLSPRVELLIAGATGEPLPLDKPIEYRNRSGRLVICTTKSAEPPPPPPDDSPFLQLGARSQWGEQMWSWLVQRAADDDGLRSIVHLHAPDLDSGDCVTCQRRSPCPTQHNLVRHYLHKIAR